MEAARWFVSGWQRQEASEALNGDRAAFGVVHQGALESPRHFEVDSENAEALDLFLALAGQWQVGPAGVMGIRMEAIEPLFRLKGVKKRRRKMLLETILAMESAALEEMADIRKKNGCNRS